MRNAMIAMMILSGGMFAGSAVLADEVVIDHPAGVLPVPVPEHHDVVVEHHRGTDCQSTTVHKEDEMGDSKTVHKEECDD
ncbi:MAG: hypothetical protein ABSC72_09030 [Methylovirgula sp.]|jgi:hypothetical protein